MCELVHAIKDNYECKNCAFLQHFAIQQIAVLHTRLGVKLVLAEATCASPNENDKQCKAAFPRISKAITYTIAQKC